MAEARCNMHVCTAVDGLKEAAAYQIGTTVAHAAALFNTTASAVQHAAAGKFSATTSTAKSLATNAAATAAPVQARPDVPGLHMIQSISTLLLRSYGWQMLGRRICAGQTSG